MMTAVDQWPRSCRCVDACTMYDRSLLTEGLTLPSPPLPSVFAVACMIAVPRTQSVPPGRIQLRRRTYLRTPPLIACQPVSSHPSAVCIPKTGVLSVQGGQGGQALQANNNNRLGWGMGMGMGCPHPPSTF